MELESIAAELLTASEYINIATVSLDGQPWNTPVTGVHDSQLNFYWSSWKHAQHSKNVRANARVFFTLYDSTRKRGDNHRKCLYVQAKAVEVEEPHDIAIATKLLYELSGAENSPEAFLKDAQRRIYKATPDNVWLNDVSESQVTSETIKMRIEVSLDGLRKLL